MSDSVIDLDDVWVYMGERIVLEAVELHVARNDYLAVIGPNGSGKTTLFRVILGLLAPDHGSVRVLGTSPRRARGRIGYVPQHPRFDPGFPVKVIDVVRMGRLGRRGMMRPFRREDRERAMEALAHVSMTDVAERPIEALSGGQRERVLIARALATDPEIMLLDEPTASLDAQTAGSFYELLAELSRRMTVVLVSHDVGTVSQHVRTIACLNRQLVTHPSGELTAEMLERAYGCPIELIGHGLPHRVLGEHDPHEHDPGYR